MKTKPTVAIWLDNRRQRTNGKYSVKIRIIYQRVAYYYPTNITLSQHEFENALSSKPKNSLKEVHLRLNELERQANDAINVIVDELNAEFSIGLFEKRLKIDSSNNDDVFRCFEIKAEQLKSRGQIRTAEGYLSASKAFRNYVDRQKLSFSEIDADFLEGFESYMLKQQISMTTIGIYCRYLRFIFNKAVEDKLVNYDLYPFGKNKYRIPQAANNKRALDEQDLLKIIQYKPAENSWEDYARDMWLFSLMCQGMNMKDIASLRYRNIVKDKIVFVREKTKNSKKADQLPITVYLTKEALEIIQKRGNQNLSANQYVFPIYSEENSPLKNLRAAEQQNKMINRYMRKIAKELKIDQDITFYAARHSFATTLKRQGRSTEEIQEFLGHSNIKTTERYLASFGDDHKRNIIQGYIKGLVGNS